MPHAEFDIVTLSPSTVRVMHKVEHHIYEFAVVEDGGRRIVRHAPSSQPGKDGPGPALEMVCAAEKVAADMARSTGVID